MLHIATEAEIKSGLVTDVYFERTKEILKAEKKDVRVTAEFMVKKFPAGYEWGVFAGLDESITLLKDLKVKVRAMPEGTFFRTYEPVMSIEGNYLEFGVYETALLGLLCQASGIATKAARCKKNAGKRLLISFGSRRMHPALAPMIERNAYIGGCDGVAVIKSAELLGIKPSGTIPHALVLILGDTVDAIRAFDKAIDPGVKRVALIDTFGDEKFEAVRAAEALGDKLYGVRLDTPASRRGNFLQILREVRWELDLRGFEHVKLFASGGLDEADILELNEVVDAYGVGTAISNAPVLDFAMDLVKIDGKDLAKRGKMSGDKQVYRCGSCLQDRVYPAGKRLSGKCPSGGKFKPLLQPLIENGRLVRTIPKPQEIRERVLNQLKKWDV